jgi:hypothetical protein
VRLARMPALTRLLSAVARRTRRGPAGVGLTRFRRRSAGSRARAGDELVLSRSSERGRTVNVFRVRDGQLEQEIVTAVPADGPLVPMLRGSYTRRPAAAAR